MACVLGLLPGSNLAASSSTDGVRSRQKPEPIGLCCPSSPGIWRDGARQASCVISPRPNSLHTLAVLRAEILRARTTDSSLEESTRSSNLLFNRGFHEAFEQRVGTHWASFVSRWAARHHPAVSKEGVSWLVAQFGISPTESDCVAHIAEFFHGLSKSEQSEESRRKFLQEKSRELLWLLGATLEKALHDSQRSFPKRAEAASLLAHSLQGLKPLFAYAYPDNVHFQGLYRVLSDLRQSLKPEQKARELDYIHLALVSTTDIFLYGMKEGIVRSYPERENKLPSLKSDMVVLGG
jgi:hypothetical protein